MNFPFYFAKKIYRDKGNGEKVSLPAIRIATMGVSVGLAVMIISICVVLGFKQEIRSKVWGMGSHIQILNFNSLNSVESQPIVTDSCLIKNIYAIPNIKHVQRFSFKTGMLKTDSAFVGITLKGIGKDYDTTFLHSHLTEGYISLNTENSNKIVISQTIADMLQLKAGDRIYAYFFENGMRTRRFTVSGIYNTNMVQFDKTMVLTDLSTVNRLNHWADSLCSGLEILTTDYTKATTNAIQINKRIGSYEEDNRNYATLTIEDLYPQVFEWLKLLDLNVWVILALMMAVSGFTTISGLLILILEKTGMIGILKSLGATNTTIRHIFLYYASFIIGKGLLYGNLLGLGLAWMQKQWNIIKLDPLTYYVETVPILFNWKLIILLNIGTLLLSLASLIGPSFLISRIQPAKTIRFD